MENAKKRKKWKKCKKDEKCEQRNRKCADISLEISAIRCERCEIKMWK